MAQLKTVFFLILFGTVSTSAFSEDVSKFELIGQSRSFFASSMLAGPGANVANLPANFDMSLFEAALGGKQSAFNGSGITTNISYPLTEGEAFTNATQLGAAVQISPEVKLGALAEIYTVIGDRSVGRTYGAPLPWNDFPRDQGVIKPNPFHSNFYNTFLEGKYDEFQYKLTGGTLPSTELPQFTRKEMNQVRLGSLVYRPPSSNSSFFEKEERKILAGRHPLMGFDFLGRYSYEEHKQVDLELFSGATEPTPILDIERNAYGGRLASDIGGGNIGVTYVFNEGSRGNGFEETQDVWSIDSSYQLADWLIPYVAFARTDYERENIRESHAGNAYVAGAALKFLKGYEIKAQYQRVEENYDLMAYHKSEHYPSNTHGPNLQITAPLSETFKLKGTIGHYRQLETSSEAGDTLFGDSFFSSNADARKGTIDVQRLEAQWKASSAVSLNGYVEHVQFYQKAPASFAIDKDIYNFYAGAGYQMSSSWSVEGGLRHILFLGDWQSLAFDSHQDIPEFVVTYRPAKDKRALLMYQYYDFEDQNIVAQGNNDYYGHQVILEFELAL